VSSAWVLCMRKRLRKRSASEPTSLLSAPTSRRTPLISLAQARRPSCAMQDAPFWSYDRKRRTRGAAGSSSLPGGGRLQPGGEGCLRAIRARSGSGFFRPLEQDRSAGLTVPPIPAPLRPAACDPPQTARPRSEALAPESVALRTGKRLAATRRGLAENRENAADESLQSGTAPSATGSTRPGRLDLLPRP
jgi:hypothetical protein